MKKIIYLISFCFSTVIVSQNTTSNTFMIAYDMHYNIGKLKNYKSMLYFGNNTSFFHWNNTIDKSSSSTDDSGNLKFHIDVTDPIGTINRHNVVTDSISTRSLWFKDVIILKEKRVHIKWDFKDETKKIGGYTCHMAVGNFRGRFYTVWYTLEIPVSIGPWKLNGLPGAILEAYDDEKRIQFYFKSIKKELNQERFAYDAIFSEGKNINIIEFERSQKELSSTIIKKLKSKLPRGASITIESTTENFLEKDFYND